MTAGVPDSLKDELNELTANQLDLVSRLAEQLAEDKRRQQCTGEKEQETEVEDRNSDKPEGVPNKASLTVKTINDNDYYYWQWREGDSIKSKYHKPKK